MIDKNRIIIGCSMHGSVDSDFNQKAIELLINNDFINFDTAPIYGRGYSIKYLAYLKRKYKNINIISKVGLNYILSNPYKGTFDELSQSSIRSNNSKEKFYAKLKPYIRTLLIKKSSTKRIIYDIQRQIEIFDKNLSCLLFHSPDIKDQIIVNKFIKLAKNKNLNFGISIEDNFKFWLEKYPKIKIQTNYDENNILDRENIIYRGLPKIILKRNLPKNEISNSILKEVNKSKNCKFIIGINSLNSAQELIKSTI